MTFTLATIHDFGTGKDVPHVVADFGFTSVADAFDFSEVDTGFELAPIFNAAFDLAPVSTTASTPDFNAIYSGTSTTKLALSPLPVSSVVFLLWKPDLAARVAARPRELARSQSTVHLEPKGNSVMSCHVSCYV